MEEVKVSSKKQDTITIKFNAHITPKVIWDSKENKFTPRVAAKNFKKDVIKLITEEGDTPEETKRLKSLKTGFLMSNRMMSLTEALDVLYGSITDTEANDFYYRDEVVTLSKAEGEYYLSQNCGGIIRVRNKNGVMEDMYHMKNIDGRVTSYTADEMDRFKREHAPVPVAEVYNG